MKAAVYAKSGSTPTVRVTEVEKPVPGDDEVLLRVRAASLNPRDYHLMRMSPHLFRIIRLLLRLPKSNGIRPGVDVAGEVEAVGRNVTGFKLGDAAFGCCSWALAEHACAPEAKLVTLPGNVTFEQAASAPVAALTAIQGLRDIGKLQPGQTVLVNGAAGGVGTFTVQIARAFGARVTGVCSTRNVDLVRSLGADHVFDYTREDFTRGGQRYDVIFDLVANHSLSACRSVMNPRGIYVGAGALSGAGLFGMLGRWVGTRALSLLTTQTFVSFLARVNREDLALVRELLATGKVAPVIDRRYPLIEVAEAMRYLQGRHARGKIIITMD